MTDAPERIWALKDALDDSDGLWVSAVYRRADMPPPSNWPQCTLYLRFDQVPRWQPIETAPKDGTPVLVWYDHDADPYQDPQNPDKLTDYGAWAESGDFLDGRGLAVAVWCDREWESQDEYGSGFWMPPVWRFHSSEHDEVCNPTRWMPLPEPPK